MASSYINDTTQPVLRTFTVNITDGLLVLTFSETVNISTFDATQLTLVDAQDMPVAVYRIRNSGTLLTNDDSPIVSFLLDTADLNAIKFNTDLFSTLGTSYITFSSDAVIDMSDNMVAFLDYSNATRARMFTDDFLPPNLIAFELDLNSSTITLTFDEAVNVIDFNPEAITLINSNVNSTRSYRIDAVRDSETIGERGLIVTFSLTTEDQNRLKAFEDFATEPSNTFLTVTDELITDTSRRDNRNSPIDISDPLMASEVFPDLIQPRLVEFVQLDLDMGTLRLQFDEPVNVSSVQFDRIMILDATGSNNYTLVGAGGRYVDTLRTVVELQLSRDDVFSIKLNPGLATSTSNSYVQIGAGAILDQGGNEVLPSERIRAASFVPDTTGPRAEGFILDMDEGILSITFDDIVDILTLQIGGIAFQRDPMGTFIVDQVQLTQPPDLRDITNSTNGFEVLIFLPLADLNNLKANLNLATAISNTYLTLTAATIDDVYGNNAIAFVRGSALEPYNFIPDTTSPVLDSFNLNIDGLGKLTLFFSETVRQEFLDTSLITLVGENSETFTVSSTNFPRTPPINMFTIVLGEEDLNVIKSLPNLASLASNSNLTISSEAVRDTNGNNLTAIDIAAPLELPMNQYTPDTTQPELRNFMLDMNTGQLFLLFTEVVNGSSFNPTGITLQNEPSFPTLQHTLTGGTWDPQFQNNITLNLTIEDLNEIKRLIGLADRNETTYISLTSATVRDMVSNYVSNPIMEIPPFDAKPVRSLGYTFDIISPQLVGFSLNLTSEKLELTFDETVNVSSLAINLITIQSEPVVNDSGSGLGMGLAESGLGLGLAGNGSGSGSGSGSGLFVPEATEDSFMFTQLTVGTVNSSYTTSTDSTIVVINLGQDDLNSLKEQTGLATAVNNTHISFPSNTIRDMNANLVVPISEFEAVRTDSFYPDLIPPELVRFDINLTREVILLTFSEVVNATSIDVTQITLQGAFDSSGLADTRTLTVGINGSVTSQIDSTEITVYLGPDDLNEIKRLTNLATSRSNTFLVSTSDTIQDMNKNQVLPKVDGINALQVTLFTADSISPSLAAFNLDLNADTLTLEFSETVNAASLNVTQITLQSEQSGVFGQNYTLTTTSQSSSADNTTIIIDISRRDSNTIKFLTELAQDIPSTYLSLTAMAIRDMNFNSVVPIPSSNSIRVSTYIADITGPVLQSFDINLDSEILSLHFDETVNVSSIQYLYFTIQSSLGIPETNYTLSAGTILGINSPDVDVMFDFHDLNQLKLDPRLATNRNNTYLVMGEGGILDLALRPNQAFTAELQAASFTPDTTRPRLLRFSANLNFETLTLNFDEPVNVSSLDTTGITLLNRQSGTSRFTLTGGNTSSDNGLQVVINFSVDDLNAIKFMEELLVDIDSAYVAIEPFTIADMNGNLVVQILPRNALNASIFVNDTTRPRLFAFDLDLDTNIMTLEFVETVNTSSINFTGISLQQSSNTSNQYTLTGGVVLDFTDSTIVQFALTRQDLNSIKAQEIALTNRTTWLTLEDFAIFDQNSQPVVPLENGHNALNVRQYTPDSTPPVLERFDLDLTAEELVLEFSETVNVIHTLNITSITLLSGPDADLITQAHTLAVITNNTFSDDIYTPSVTVRLGRPDLNEIKRIIDLATSENDTYISISSTLVSDMKLNPVIAIPVSSPLRVTSYVEDTTSPVLESFNLDMNLGVLTLSFSETIDPKTLDLSQFALQHAQDVVDPQLVHILTGGVVNGDPNPWIAINLTDTDLNEIKRLIELATHEGNTYLRMAAAGIQDMNDNYVVPVTDFNALRVSRFTPDETRPELTGFDLNLSTERLILTFSETVNTSSVIVTGITVQFAAYSDPPGLRQLVGGMVLTPDDTIVEIQLSSDDLNYIKSIPTLTTSTVNTYLRIENYTVVDMNSNTVVEIINGRAIQVGNFTEDDQRPVLIAFDLDMNTGMIHLTFNETVNVSSLIVEQITLQSDLYETENTTQFMFNSASGTRSNSPDWPTITINIGTDDLNEIKRLSDLAISANTTYLSLTQFSIEDTNANRVVPTVITVTNYTEDATPPEVTSFTFDLNLGQLHFTFSETVNVSSLDVTQITLQSVQNSTTSSYNVRLAGGVILTRFDNTTASVELLKVDLDTVKALPFATSRYNTFLSVTSDYILDMNDNPLVPRPENGALMADGFIPDTTRPELEGFSLDLNTAVLTFTFSETVDTTTLNLPEIMLQSAEVSNSTYAFTTSTWSMDFSPIVYIFISKVDLDSLKRNRQVGTDMNDTFITITNFTIQDTSGNAVIPITDGMAMQVALYIQDTTPPELERFDLDVDSGRLTLFYSETIDIFSLDPTQVTLQSSPAISTSLHSYTLTGGYVVPEDSTVANVELTITDLNELKRLIYLATCTVDDTYLSLIVNTSFSFDANTTTSSNSTNVTDTSNNTMIGSGLFTSGSGIESGIGSIPEPLSFSTHVFDMAGNPVVAVPSAAGLRVDNCTEDTTRPQLVAFTLNMHNSTLLLTFDETVNSSSLDLVEITFYDSFENSTEFYQLTAGYANVQDLAGQVEIEVVISNIDLNELKRRENLATEMNNTLISVTRYLVLDMNQNQNVEIRPENASTVDVFIPDERSPVLLLFELDLTLEILTLSFTETVNASSLNVSGITVQNENFTSYRTLEGGYFLTPETGGPTLGPNDPILIIQLDQSDLNYIKSRPDLATSLNNTYLSVETFTVADMNNNLVEAVLPSAPLQVSVYMEDLVQPELVSFNLDIDSGDLFLTFSETVNVSTLDVSQLTIQSAEYSPPIDQLSFTPGNTSFDTFSTSPDWPQIVVQIGINDLNEIKRLTQLATSNFTTFLSLTQDTIQDMNGNSVVPIGNRNATQVIVFTPDTTDPLLVSFSFDLDSGNLSMTFDETVDFSSLNFTSVTIQNSQFSDNISVQLTGGNISNIYDSTIVSLVLTIDNQNEIKRIRPLATTMNNTYITLTQGGILDMNGNPVVMVNSSYALQVSMFQEDVTSPLLVTFDLDMDTGTIYLTFDETVEASSLDVMQITLQDATLASTPNNTYILTGGYTSVDDSTILVVNFTFFDLNEIKKIRGLASNPNGTNSFIVITNMTLVDMNFNPIVPISDGLALRVNTFTEDLTPPELLSFDLDLDLGILVLNFSETVDTLTFNVTQFTLQSSENVSNSLQMYTLTEPYLLTGDEVIIVQGLLYFDFNTIKSLGELATSPDDTYLWITEAAIRDMNANPVVSISPYTAIQVTRYQDDITRPRLEAFDLDMNLGELTLTFSETVNVTTLDVTEILLLNNEDSNITQSYSLTNASYSRSPDWPIFVLQIGPTDLNEIKRLVYLAISNDTTFIQLTENVIRDTASNMNLPSNATAVSRFTPDETRPELISFDLNLSQDVLTLRFSETVRASTLNATQLTLVSRQLDMFFTSTSVSGSGSGDGGIAPIVITNYTLTSGDNLPLTRDSTELQLQLTFQDRNEVKRLTDLATSPRNTFISITAAFIEDMNANPIEPIEPSSPLNVSTYTPDLTPPTLLDFDLDMDAANLTLYFSETVNVDSLNVSAITLQSTETFFLGVTESHTLNDFPRPFGSHSNSQNGPTVVIEIGETDLNAIKFLTQLAQDYSSTYLSVSAYAIRDMNDNRVVEISDLFAADVRAYMADVTGPILRNFSLNLTSERLTLTFDETVDFSSIQPDLITIQNAEIPTSYYRLSQAVPIGENSSILTLNLTATKLDLNQIKLRDDLATDLDNTFISLMPGAVSDLALFPNAILNVTQSADEFYPDLIPPEILSFDVNINASTLTLVFSEVVNASSLDPTAVRLQNDSNVTTAYVDLTGECVCVCVCVSVCVSVCV